MALLIGPWLRVTQVSWSGERYTDAEAVADILESQRGVSLLAVNMESLRGQIQDLPAVADARIEALLPDGLRATIVEREPALVWQTWHSRLVAAGDGTIIAALPRGGPLPDALAALQLVDDDRRRSRLMTVGDRLPPGLRETARRLAAIDPAALGSRAARVAVRIDSEYGFVLASTDPAWRIAFGFYADDADASVAEIATRIERQVTAVRTLFASRAEATIGWVDARNPGKVYFRAKG